jgi:hypothetical protein
MKLTSILLLAFSVLAMPASCGTAQVEPEIVPGLVESGGSRLSARYATCTC